MKYFRFIITLIGISAFSACSDDDNTGNTISNQITNATKNIYKEWGSASSYVKEYMNDYNLAFSGDNMLQYSSKDNNIMFTYSFNDDKLDAAALIIEEDFDPAPKKGYEYIGDINHTNIYKNDKENTMCSVYKQIYNEQTYTIIGYAPIESDLYNDLPNIEFALGSISEVTSNSAKVSVVITGISKSAICGVKYCTSSSFDKTTKKIVGTINGDKLEISLTGLKMGVEYYYYIYVEDNDVLYTSETDSFTTIKLTSGYVNGHKWIDLGLPSGVKWATYDVGANQEGEYGDYFAWGELTTRANMSSPWSDYQWGRYEYSNGSSMRDIGSNISGKSRYDAARHQWKGAWRMPTLEEMNELIECCNFKITASGGLFTGPNGNSISFPFSGEFITKAYTGEYGKFWTSELSGPYHAHHMIIQKGQEYAKIKSNNSTSIPGGTRSSGYTIRAVIDIE